MNILDNSAIRPCTSCQMCSAVCNSQAISIRLDEEGFYRPYIDADRCTDCGLCTKVCPKYDENLILTSDSALEHTRLYAASAKDDNVVNSTTSGGVADLLAHKLIEEGFKVVGVVYDNKNNNAKHTVASTLDEIIPFRGSKYIQSYSAEAFRQVIKECRKEKYAVFGLPCQIYALSQYLHRINKRDQCILIDLYCHGCPSMHVWNKVSEDIRTKKGVDSFDNVLWRSKLKGWGTYALEVQKDGKRIYNSQPMHNEFFELFFCNQILNESCNTCQLRGTLAYTDIRLGDYWGPKYRKSLRGVSGVSVVTPQGQGIFNKITKQLDFKEMPAQTFFPYQSWNHEYKANGEIRSLLMTSLQDEYKSCSEVTGLLPSHRTLSYKIKICVKQLFYYLPLKFNIVIRKS